MSQVREWGSQFTSNLGTSWTDPGTARRVPSKWRRIERGAKGSKGEQRKPRHVHNSCLVRVYIRMLGVIERYQLYMCIIIIIGMNVVNNLNSV
jgi:hypothetical protein